jgi:alpha-1,2-mannosyltransferase
MLVASHVGYFVAIWLMLTRLTPLPDDRLQRTLFAAFALVYCFLFDAAATTLAAGQINLVVLPFLCLALVGMEQRSSAWKIALPLSIAILLKTYPVVLLMPLFFHRRWKAVFLTCALFAGYTALALLVLPHEAWISWFRDVLPFGGYANDIPSPAAAPWNQNINAFVSRLLLPNRFVDTPLPAAALAKPIATALALAVVATTAWFSFRCARRAGAGVLSPDEAMSFLLMIFLIAPLSWDHHLVYVLPAAVFAIALLTTGRIATRQAAAVFGALLVIALPLPYNEEPLRHGWWTLVISIKFYGALTLWFFFVNRLRCEATTPAANPPAMRAASSFPPPAQRPATAALHTR